MSQEPARFFGVEGALWRHWWKIVSRFATLQVAVQALGALTGLVIVRFLAKDDYALFTIATSLQASASLITDCGINAGLLAIGGRCWNDREAFGQVVASSLRLRRRLALLAGAVIAPIAMWLLMRNGASLALAVVLSILVVAAVQLVSATATYATVLKLSSRHDRLQLIDAGNGALRLVSTLTASLAILNASMAMMIATIAQGIQLIATRSAAIRHYSSGISHAPDHDRYLTRLVRENFTFSLYVAVQGQLAIFILSLIGTADQIADVGALTRLSVIAAIVTTFLNYIASPVFARAASALQLVKTIMAGLIAVTIIASLILTACLLLPGPILWILGPQYLHLEYELMLVGLSVAMNLYLAVFWTVNTARAWLHLTWILAPLTIALQVLLARHLALDSVSGILWFSILSQVPNLVWSVAMTWRGLHIAIPAQP